MAVLNKHAIPGRNIPAGAVYIGRPSKWGNPFAIGKDGSRDQVIQKFEAWLQTQPALMEAARRELRGRDLVCFCAPQACHGDVLARVAAEAAEAAPADTFLSRMLRITQRS